MFYSGLATNTCHLAYQDVSSTWTVGLYASHKPNLLSRVHRIGYDSPHKMMKGNKILENGCKTATQQHKQRPDSPSFGGKDEITCHFSWQIPNTSPVACQSKKTIHHKSITAVVDLIMTQLTFNLQLSQWNLDLAHSQLNWWMFTGWPMGNIWGTNLIYQRRLTHPAKVTLNFALKKQKTAWFRVFSEVPQSYSLAEQQTSKVVESIL